MHSPPLDGAFAAPALPVSPVSPPPPPLPPLPTWVRRFCARPDSFRTQLQDPGAVRWRGAPAALATNGHKLVVVPGEFDAIPFAEPIGSSALRLVEQALARPSRTVRLGALRAFAGLPLEAPTDCAACGMTGRVACETCDGSGEAECTCPCGDAHEADCEDCDDGFVSCADCQGPAIRGRNDSVDRVAIGGGHFNRWLLAEVLGALPRPADPARAIVRWHAGRYDSDTQAVAAAVSGEGWTVLIMPIRLFRDVPPNTTFDAWEPGDADDASDAAELFEVAP